jgi:hypothetical protein
VSPSFTTRAGLLQAVGHRIGRIQPFHIRARHHQRGQRPIVKPKHVLHHLVLMLLDHARVDTLFEAGSDFFFGHGTRAGSVNA